MGEREKIWVVCRTGFVGTSGYEYKKGAVYKGYKEGEKYYLTLPGFSRKVGISEPGKDSVCFNLIDPFLVNINKVLE